LALCFWFRTITKRLAIIDLCEADLTSDVSCLDLKW